MDNKSQSGSSTSPSNPRNPRDQPQASLARRPPGPSQPRQPHIPHHHRHLPHHHNASSISPSPTAPSKVSALSCALAVAPSAISTAEEEGVTRARHNTGSPRTSRGRSIQILLASMNTDRQPRRSERGRERRLVVQPAIKQLALHHRPRYLLGSDAEGADWLSVDEMDPGEEDENWCQGYASHDLSRWDVPARGGRGLWCALMGHLCLAKWTYLRSLVSTHWTGNMINRRTTDSMGCLHSAGNIQDGSKGVSLCHGQAKEV